MDRWKRSMCRDDKRRSEKSSTERNIFSASAPGVLSRLVARMEPRRHQAMAQVGRSTGGATGARRREISRALDY